MRYSMFDFNGDGKLDSFERAAEYKYMDSFFHRDRHSDNSFDDEGDVFGDAGLDYEELEMMDPVERRGILEDAGLDPDEYDF